MVHQTRRAMDDKCGVRCNARQAEWDSMESSSRVDDGTCAIVYRWVWIACRLDHVFHIERLDSTVPMFADTTACAIESAEHSQSRTRLNFKPWSRIYWLPCLFKLVQARTRATKTRPDRDLPHTDSIRTTRCLLGRITFFSVACSHGKEPDPFELPTGWLFSIVFFSSLHSHTHTLCPHQFDIANAWYGNELVALASQSTFVQVCTFTFFDTFPAKMVQNEGRNWTKMTWKQKTNRCSRPSLTIAAVMAAQLSIAACQITKAWNVSPSGLAMVHFNLLAAPSSRLGSSSPPIPVGTGRRDHDHDGEEWPSNN